MWYSIVWVITSKEEKGQKKKVSTNNKITKTGQNL